MKKGEETFGSSKKWRKRQRRREKNNKRNKKWKMRKKVKNRKFHFKKVEEIEGKENIR